MPPEPDVAYVFLRSGCSRDVLEHRGTGEMVRLDGRFVLEFEGSGAFVSPIGGEDAPSTWAADLFKKTYHKSACGRFFVRDDTGSARWVDELLLFGTQSKVFSADVDDYQLRPRTHSDFVVRGCMSICVIVLALAPRVTLRVACVCVCVCVCVCACVCAWAWLEPSV